MNTTCRLPIGSRCDGTHHFRAHTAESATAMVYEWLLTQEPAQLSAEQRNALHEEATTIAARFIGRESIQNLCSRGRYSQNPVARLAEELA